MPRNDYNNHSKSNSTKHTAADYENRRTSTVADPNHVYPSSFFDSEETTEEETGSDHVSWVSWFCSLHGHEFFCEVADEFIEDEFNLTGLNNLVPNYRDALDMILDLELDDDTHEAEVEASAEILYGLIHQRFILTRQGQHLMLEKYENGDFGYCLRVLCSGTPLLPCGTSDELGVDTVRMYCPCCRDLYQAPSPRFYSLDGAYWGTTFPHLFVMSYPEVAAPPVDGYRSYEPKLFGFCISENADVPLRCRWLRMRFNEKEQDVTVWTHTGARSRRGTVERGRTGGVTTDAAGMVAGEGLKVMTD